MKWDIVDLNQFNIVKEQGVYDFSIIVIVVRRTLVTSKLVFDKLSNSNLKITYKKII